jgi:hypothetical protein
MKFLKSLFGSDESYQQQIDAKVEAEVLRLQQVNAVKRAKSIEFLGTKWLLHPSNRINGLDKSLTLNS